MSAWIVSKAHIDYMVAAACAYNTYGFLRLSETEARRDNADEIGRALWGENVRSVKYRYSGSPRDDLPGPVPTPEPAAYTFAAPRRPLDPVTTLKAIACYEYQSCETPDWRETPAFRFCDDLRHAAINALPGYGAAPWGFGDEEGAA